MLRRVLPLALLLLALPPAARADWAWTRWGMDAASVRSASGGGVKAARGRPGQQVHGWDLRAAGRVEQDGLRFRAEFFFDPDGAALHVVKLTPRLKDCQALRRQLNERYGPATDESFVVPSSNPIRITVLSWRDPANGNFVGYSENPVVGKLKAGCFVRYRPLAESDKPQS